MPDFTTVALTDEDKSSLDNIGERRMDEENPSYRKIINFLVEKLEEQQEEYDHVLAKAIARADGQDVKRVVTRVESDKEFVEELNNEK